MTTTPSPSPPRPGQLEQAARQALYLLGNDADRQALHPGSVPPWAPRLATSVVETLRAALAPLAPAGEVAVQTALARAAREAREECAKVCEQGEFKPVGSAQYKLGYFDGCLSAAKAIRALPVKP